MLVLRPIALFSVFWMSVVSAQGQSLLNGFGYIPTPQVELQTYASTGRYRGYLPQSVDLSKRFPTPGNQGELNSCVAWAVGYAARSYYAVTSEARPRNSRSHIPSPSYIYQLIRQPSDCQSGSKLPDAFKLLQNGSLSLAEYPYSVKCTTPRPSDIAKAKDFTIEKWVRIDSTRIDDIKGELARGDPVVFGMQVDEKFHNMRGSGTYSREESRFLDNHAMTAVGYDDRRQAIRFINSWGRNWGDGGFGWISYATFRSLVLEAYSIRVPNRIPLPTPRPPDLPPEELTPEPAVDPDPPKNEEQQNIVTIEEPEDRKEVPIVRPEVVDPPVVEPNPRIEPEVPETIVSDLDDPSDPVVLPGEDQVQPSIEEVRTEPELWLNLGDAA